MILMTYKFTQQNLAEEALLIHATQAEEWFTLGRRKCTHCHFIVQKHLVSGQI